VTAKKSAATEPPTEFDWLSLAQPTPEKDTWEVVEDKSHGDGPWRVRDASGLEFSTHVLVKGLTVLEESPFDRSGVLRTPSGGIDTAPAE
jgi:hypothetical protein